ncbi:hypothetical protein OIE66_16100 [Nonomuraea sp. NBC_01738]|nr:hypothetical protein OIE66_16100 [Nonomuraea sp. NBC_01738]
MRHAERLVAADVQERAGGERGHLGQHVSRERRRPLRVEVGEQFVRAVRARQFRVRPERGLAVPRQVDLRDDGDEPVGRVGHEAEVVGAAVELRPVAVARAVGPRPVGGVGEARVAGDLQPPRLAVGQVQVQHVEPEQGEQVDDLLDLADGEEAADHVERQAAPPQRGAVEHVDAGNRERVTLRPGELGEGGRAAEQAGP